MAVVNCQQERNMPSIAGCGGRKYVCHSWSGGENVHFWWSGEGKIPSTGSHLEEEKASIGGHCEKEN